MNRGYQTASKKYREQNPDQPNETTRDPSTTQPAPPAAGGMPDLSSLLGAFGGGAGRGGGAGGADLASLMNNPMLMNMVQQVTSSGALNDLMNNPRMRELAQQMMSGDRNIGDLMSDPDVMNM
jgi:small glutamine-rich tetratricopeptide repeat-containing protein alpha